VGIFTKTKVYGLAYSQFEGTNNSSWPCFMYRALRYHDVTHEGLFFCHMFVPINTTIHTLPVCWESLWMMRTSHLSRDCCCQVMCTVMVIQYHCGQTFSTHLGEGEGPLAQPREDVQGVAPRIFLLTFSAKFSRQNPWVFTDKIFVS